MTWRNILVRIKVWWCCNVSFSCTTFYFSDAFIVHVTLCVTKCKRQLSDWMCLKWFAVRQTDFVFWLLAMTFFHHHCNVLDRWILELAPCSGFRSFFSFWRGYEEGSFLASECNKCLYFDVLPHFINLFSAFHRQAFLKHVNPFRALWVRKEMFVMYEP